MRIPCEKNVYVMLLRYASSWITIRKSFCVVSINVCVCLCVYIGLCPVWRRQKAKEAKLQQRGPLRGGMGGQGRHGEKHGAAHTCSIQVDFFSDWCLALPPLNFLLSCLPPLVTKCNGEQENWNLLHGGEEKCWQRGKASPVCACVCARECPCEPLISDKHMALKTG